MQNVSELLRCVPYIIDEKSKIQQFLNCFPFMFKEQIEYDNPKMLEEAMRKETSVTTKTKIEGKLYQLGSVKRKITLIQERNIINSTKTQGITIRGIKEITKKNLSHKIL